MSEFLANPLVANAVAVALNAGLTAAEQMLANRNAAAMTPEERDAYEKAQRAAVAAESQDLIDYIDQVNAAHPINPEDDGA